jgi:ABC-type Fe3+/spermidine/putrescine transport system ATPase subunit
VSNVSLKGIEKRFGDTAVVKGVSLDVADGELVALLGPSGSGKTTLLRLIAGFEHPDMGRIVLGDKDVTAEGALARRCGMVFQHYALFPHLDVGQNVAYGLAHEKLERTATESRVAEALALVDLEGYQERAVSALSGGQQQRVAVARALAPRPSVLLLDEPLSNLDPSLRERTRRELRELVRRIGITTVLVTHEQEEAFDLADRVALLLDGVLAQVGTPEELYQTPANPAVARFIGRSVAVPAERIAQSSTVSALGTIFDLGAALPAGAGPLQLMLRPESLSVEASGPISGTVTERRFTGLYDLLLVTLADAEVEVLATPSAHAVGDSVRLAPTGNGAHAFEVSS